MFEAKVAPGKYFFHFKDLQVLSIIKINKIFIIMEKNV